MKKRIPNSPNSVNINMLIDKKQNNIKINDKKTPFYKKLEFWIFTITTLISIAALVYFYFSGQKNLADYDAIARLNIARKITDSLTPGFAQLGGIWLPFPQVLFLPFVSNNFLWHSGLAGAFASMTAFILSSFFLYKTVYLITGKKIGGLIAWLVYVTNINMLWLQTMAMSESFFLFTLIMIIYFLTKWVKSRDILHLLYAALFVVLTTLTRYEGYALFGAATLSVAAVILTTFTKSDRKRLEGTLVLFMTLAGFGIFLWAFYSFLIFKDPIYWLNLYSGNKSITALDPAQLIGNQPSDLTIHSTTLTLTNTFKIYGSAMMLMNGVLLSVLAAFGFIYLLAQSGYDIIKKKIDTLVLPIMIMTICVFSFLIIGYLKGLIPNIETPLITFANIFDRSKNLGSSSNIRYGIIILPLIALIVGLVYSKTKYLVATAILLLAFQLYSLFTPPLFLTFSLPRKVTYSQIESSSWFRNNYDNGLILISANRHENFMFQTGLAYKNFIYEGSQDIWKDSLIDPSQSARWVVYASNIKGDAVNELMEDKSILIDKYNLAHEDSGILIYKLK